MEKCTIMISSTMLDLPEHRTEVMDACLRQGMFPAMMDYLPASDDEAVSVSLRMVDDADIYVGIFAHRYGYVPKGHAISITEMEYNRAVERSIPRLIFLMHKDHPIKIEDVEMEKGAVKLNAFKKRLLIDNIVNHFKSPTDLRAHVINSLSMYRKSDITHFHYDSNIPAPPNTYIAHPYTLLQTHQLIGRQDELNLLTDWVTKREEQVYWARILNIIAIGGMGKSALTWKWFNEIAPQEMKPLTGKMWWSFYESDASFENFVIRALGYVTNRSREETKIILPPEREAQLLAILDREPFLFVLDGLERILLAYARIDAARLEDNQVSSQRMFRKTYDPRIGRFIKKLAQVKNSRILVSSRLYPTELEKETGDPIPGSYRHDIAGLSDKDAIELWRAFGITGSRDELLPIFIKFDKHPLLIQALAGEVKKFRRAPGNFAEWRKANKKFDPAKFLHVQDAMAHVLRYALHGLDDKPQKVLETIAAFRMPATYDLPATLFVENPAHDYSIDSGHAYLPKESGAKLFPSELGLDVTLKELEDRGLMDWDKRANRYDLHPIVRSVVWNGLPSDTRKSVFRSLQAHFNSVPKVDMYEVKSVEELTPAIELYNTLIGLSQWDDALAVLQDRLHYAMLYRLSANRNYAELVEMLFTDGVNQLPRVSQPRNQSFTINELALVYQFTGQPGRAAPLFQKSFDINEKEDDPINMSIDSGNLAYALLVVGALHESESAARHSLAISRKFDYRSEEGINSNWLGITLATRNLVRESELILQRASHMCEIFSEIIWEDLAKAFLAQRALWLGNPKAALSLAEQALRLANKSHHERSFCRIPRIQGAAELELGNFPKARVHLNFALIRARTVNYVEEELRSLVSLSELERRLKNFKAAHELLNDVWEAAESGPYTLIHADAFNVLAQIELDEGNPAKAVEAAIKAYRLAWCDGPPFSYHWGLEAAKKHLKELDAPEPQMPPFNANKYNPMPELEIDPDDEYRVGKTPVK